MPRRRSRKNDPEDLFRSILGLFAGLAMLCYLTPLGRAFLALLPMLLMVGTGAVVVSVVIWLLIRTSKKRPVEMPLVESASTRDLTQLLEKSVLDRTIEPSQSLQPATFELPEPRQEKAVAKEINQPVQITADLLEDLEWRRFEILVTAYFEKLGYRAWRNRVGADGGIDILLAQSGEQQPCACVQCKAWNAYKIGVKPIRELFGVMAAEKITSGFFVISGEYTREALDFARDKPVTLISGRQLLHRLKQLPEADHANIYRLITTGDYTTPTCPRCDIKMVERNGPKGPFWGCRSYPNCRQHFNFRVEAPSARFSAG